MVFDGLFFAADESTAGFGVALAILSATAAAVFLRIESPGGGGASGCRKYTGNRIDTGIGVPRNFAGSNFSSRDPLIAAESRVGIFDDSITRVESSTTNPSLSTYNRSVTLPCTFSAYNAGGYLNGMSLFSIIGYVSGLAIPASNAVLVPSPLEQAAISAKSATDATTAVQRDAIGIDSSLVMLFTSFVERPKLDARV